MNQATHLFSCPAKALIITCSAVLVVACAKQDGSVAMVKNGTLSNCQATVGKMVDGFMENPSWESGVSENQQKFVNVSGGITYMGKPVKAVVQFMLNEKEGTFQYNAFEVNEIPQDNLIAAALLEKMCENGGGASTAQADTASEPAGNGSNGAKYSREELNNLLRGKSKGEVLKILGKPAETAMLAGSESILMWTYLGISYDADTGAADDVAQVQFMDGAVFQIVFM